MGQHSYDILHRFMKLVLYLLPTKLGEGNVFTGVHLFTEWVGGYPLPTYPLSTYSLPTYPSYLLTQKPIPQKWSKVGGNHPMECILVS